MSVPAVDLLVELAESHPKVFGARLTGGGFGGAIVIAAAGDCGAQVASQVRAAYAQRFGREVTVLIPF